MASWQFSYPYNATDQATVYFSPSSAYGGALFHWRRGGGKDLIVPRQSVLTLPDGSNRAVKMGESGRDLLLRFDHWPSGSAATPTQLYGHDGVVEFFTTWTDWKMRTFGYYGPLGGAEVEVRMTDFDFEDVMGANGGAWRGFIRLAVEL